MLVRAFVGGVSQTLAYILLVAWVHKMLARIKNDRGFKITKF